MIITQASFKQVYRQTAQNSRLDLTDSYKQHKNTTTLMHSIAVAYYSYRVARLLKFMINFNERDLIRGALLHDYYLYDWHEKSTTHKLHGFYHPSKALDNANFDFELSAIEKDIIKKHMFPLTVVPPKYRESVVVCMIDKACCIYESVKKTPYQKNKSLRDIYEERTIKNKSA